MTIRHTGTQEEKSSRRVFLSALGITGLSLSGIIAFFANLLYLKPAVDYGPPKIFRVGYPDNYNVGARETFDKEKVLVVREKQGFAIISLVCTHLGCTVRSSDAGFECPCHGSQYDENGVVTGGPAPRPLNWYQISLAPNGELEVNKSAKVSKETYFQV